MHSKNAVDSVGTPLLLDQVGALSKGWSSEVEELFSEEALRTASVVGHGNRRGQHASCPCKVHRLFLPVPVL